MKDYKKLYEDANKRVAARFGSDVARELFKDLYENENEKIRREIISALNMWYADESLIDPLGKYTKKQAVAWLGKQGENKPFDYENAYIQQKDFAPKVEPKFKVGDWVVQGHNILKIKCIGNEYYCFETVGGYVDDMLVSEIDSQFHLWTIEDAKDGDVLYFDNLLVHGSGILIYKSDKSNHYIITKYCSVNEFGFEPNSYITLNDGYIIPATKEQRNLLFRKMHEAGYYWDADNKELKKIEQKDEKSKMTPFEKEVSEIIDEAIEDDKGLFNVCEKLLSLAKDEIEQKPSWSEDDKEQLDRAIYMMGQLGLTKSWDDVYNWLKSLKDRI